MMLIGVIAIIILVIRLEYFLGWRMVASLYVELALMLYIKTAWAERYHKRTCVKAFFCTELGRIQKPETIPWFFQKV